MTSRRINLTAVLLSTLAVSTAWAADWNRSFFGSNFDVWRKRIPVQVHNTSTQKLQGSPASCIIGTSTGELNLVNVDATALRISDDKATDLLFKITTPDGRILQRGAIPAGSRLEFPVSIQPDGRAAYYVYFDNPSAFPVSETLKTDKLKSAKSDSASSLIIQPGPVEDLPVSWPTNRPAWPVAFRDNVAAVAIPLRVTNFSDSPRKQVLISGNLGKYMSRGMDRSSIAVFDGEKKIDHLMAGNEIFFEGTIPPHSARIFHVYYVAQSFPTAKTIEGLEQIVPPEVSASDDSLQVGSIPSNQVYRESTSESRLKEQARLVEKTTNLIQNPSFEETTQGNSGWSNGAEGSLPPGTILEIQKGSSIHGSNAAHLSIPKGSKPTWIGWRQKVPVTSGRSYLVSFFTRTRNFSGALDGNLHLHDSTGRTVAMQSIGLPVFDNDWQNISEIITVPDGVTSMTLHLTTDRTGEVWFDAALISEVATAFVDKPVMQDQSRPGLYVWAVNPIIKLFQDMLPPANLPQSLQISLARNEQEPLQLAIRSDSTDGPVSIEIQTPTGIEAPSVRTVGFVPIGAKSAYTRSPAPAWAQKRNNPAGNTDGWPDWWPDPLLPQDNITLTKGQTSAFWLTFRTNEQTKSGSYACKVHLKQNNAVIKEIPLTVTVRNFDLPRKANLNIIYDLRLTSHWNQERPSLLETKRAIAELMHQNRITPERIFISPEFTLSNGVVKADFVEFDKLAEWYFNQEGVQVSYMPDLFYGFGWAHPPRKIFNIDPYTAPFPYNGVDRGELNPEYKRVYQDALRLFWNHVREKGWQDKFVLYISDEPHYTDPNVVAQMKALCNMIHAVDKNIKIYSSTWGHCPAWDGYLDIWGIAHYGKFPQEDIARLSATGSSFWYTTDGQLCTDTPYLGFERMMPYYCFKYGVKAYEFWGIGWLTTNPYQFGWHDFIAQSDKPGDHYYIQYPNGDGYLLYPGKLGGYSQTITSIRFEQTREGSEDFEYLFKLRQLIAQSQSVGIDVSRAKRVLSFASRLVSIPNSGGRYSTSFLPNPEVIPAYRELVATEIEKLQTAIHNRK